MDNEVIVFDPAHIAVVAPAALTAAGSPLLLELVDDPAQTAAAEALRAMYAAARAIVADRLRAGLTAAAGDGSVEITPEEWAAITDEYAGDTFGDGVLDGVIAAAIVAKVLTPDRRLADTIERHRNTLAGYGPSLSASVSAWVDEQTAAGSSAAQIVEALDQPGSPLAPDRAEFVARTEMTAAVNAGLTEGMDAAGIAAKRWVSQRDGRVRRDHIVADGQTVPVGQDFTIGGWPASYPGDPRLPIGERANCRCYVTDVDGLFVRRAVAATKADLNRTASEFGIAGRSTMNKGALQAAILQHLCLQGLAGGADCPQTLARMNRTTLLAHARSAGIEGRHAMTRDELVARLDDALRGTPGGCSPRRLPRRRRPRTLPSRRRRVREQEPRQTRTVRPRARRRRRWGRRRRRRGTVRGRA